MTGPLERCARRDLDEATAGVLRRYDEPWRAYHTREHLREGLVALDGLADGLCLDADERRVARLALWFHDAVYDPQRPDNEERSAELAEVTLRGLGEPIEVVARVARLVRATASHRVPDGDPAGAVLMDADLWILAAPAERYDAYVAQVRREYAHVTDADFARGRSAVLTDLAARDRLYLTPVGRERWEERARANLARERRRRSD